MLANSILLLSASLALTQASPISPAQPNIFKREQALCDQFSYYQTGNGYNLNNNAWGRNDATSGEQCTTFQKETEKGVAWKSNWNWQGGEGYVKSYPYSGKVFDPKIVSQIQSMGTYFAWGYDNENIRADVAYDIFTAADPNHDKSFGDFEVMIWLGKYGDVRPISDSGSPVASPTLAGQTWDLYDGYNKDMHVYSFVAKNAPLKTWGGDAKEFFNHITTNNGFPADSQYLITFQAGTEPFTGGPTQFSVGEFNAFIR